MKTAIVPSSEFVTGEGRAKLRRAKSAEHLKAQAEKTRERFNDRIGHLAKLRLLLLIPWWQQKFPKRELRVRFGYGNHFVDVDNRQVDLVPDVHGKLAIEGVRVPAEMLAPLLEALDDVLEITNSYSDGCPDDITIEPRVKR